MVSYLDVPCRLHLLGGAGIVAGTQCRGPAGERESSHGSPRVLWRAGEEASACPEVERELCEEATFCPLHLLPRHPGQGQARRRCAVLLRGRKGPGL